MVKIGDYVYERKRYYIDLSTTSTDKKILVGKTTEGVIVEINDEHKYYSIFVLILDKEGVLHEVEIEFVTKDKSLKDVPINNIPRHRKIFNLLNDNLYA